MKEKEAEVSNLLLRLFSLQINGKIHEEHTQKVLKQFKNEDRDKVPFNEIFLKIWICLADPDSLEAQTYLNDKAIAELIHTLKGKNSKLASACNA